MPEESLPASSLPGWEVASRKAAHALPSVMQSGCYPRRLSLTITCTRPGSCCRNCRNTEFVRACITELPCDRIVARLRNISFGAFFTIRQLQSSTCRSLTHCVLLVSGIGTRA